MVVIQYSLDGEFIRKWDSEEDIETELGINKEGIVKCCKNKSTYFCGYVWRNIKQREITYRTTTYGISQKFNTTPILQFTSSGRFIKEWKNSQEIENNLGYSLFHIKQCCCGLYNIVDGYMWRFKSDFKEVPERIPDNNYCYAPILQYDKNGNFLAEWSTIDKAEFKLGLEKGSIKKAMIFKIDKSEKYIWRYKIENCIYSNINTFSGEYFSREYNFENNVIQYGLDGKLIKIWNNQYEAEINLKFKLKNINVELSQFKDFLWQRRIRKKVKCEIDVGKTIVLQYNQEGNLVNIWDSIELINSILVLQLKNTQKQELEGYTWVKQNAKDKIKKNLKDVIIKKQTRLPKKTVVQFNLDGNIIAEWKSLEEARSITKIPLSEIKACCERKRLVSNGYIWRYKKDL